MTSGVYAWRGFFRVCVTQRIKHRRAQFSVMKKKMTTVTFNGTEEQKAKLFELIEKYKGMQGNMLPVLQGAQEIYGYLPIEVQTMIAE